MLFFTTAAAHADVLVRVEGGLAGPLTNPARDYFGLGFAAGGSISFDVLPFLDLGASGSYLFLSGRADSPFQSPASLITVGPSARLHRPRKDARVVPWLDVSVHYARTGPLDRLGLSVAAGCQFPVIPDVLSLGPWLGVEQVFRIADAATYPTRDATLLSGGVSFELAAFHPRPRSTPPLPPAEPTRQPPAKTAAAEDFDRDGLTGAADRCPMVPEDLDGFDDGDGCPDTDDDQDGVLDRDDACPRKPGSMATLGCPDGDGDGIADQDDRCPAAKGVPLEQGCPTYRGVTVGTGSIVLDRSLDFAKAQTHLSPRASTLVDEVARALTDRPTLCVRLLGHGDPKGKLEANDRLGQARAETVRTHLMAKGISPLRLTATGAGATTPFSDVELMLVPCEVRAP